MENIDYLKYKKIPLKEEDNLDKHRGEGEVSYRNFDSLLYATLFKSVPHIYKWINTSSGGFAQCKDCSIIDTDIKEKDCEGYIDPTILEQERKAKRKAEAERKKQATIEWLKKNKK